MMDKYGLSGLLGIVFGEGHNFNTSSQGQPADRHYSHAESTCQASADRVSWKYSVNRYQTVRARKYNALLRPRHSFLGNAHIVSTVALQRKHAKDLNCMHCIYKHMPVQIYTQDSGRTRLPTFSVALN